MPRITLLPILAVALTAACDRTPQPLAPEDALPWGMAASVHTTGLLPDLRTVVPQHLQIVMRHGRETLRFSNGIANTGAGPLHLRPERPVDGTNGTQNAIQDVFDGAGNVVHSQTVSQFEFHPTHNHWHIDAVALYEVRAGAHNGPVLGGTAIKTTFCLIDWIRLEGVSSTPGRAYDECNGAAQGISAGWVDQYHHATPGQALDITDLVPGTYYLVSTANPDHTFLETDLTNNVAWVGFALTRPNAGKARITITDRSPCTGGLCGSPENR